MSSRANSPGLDIAALCVALSMAGCGAGDHAPSAAFEAARSRASTPEREWRAYLGDAESSQSSPLDQIHRGNVDRLEVAWTYDSRDAEVDGASQIQFNPLVVKGVLYGASPSLRFFALDASTGEELWSFRPDVDIELWTAVRGAVYWEDGDDERIVFGAGPRLHAVDARTGRPIASFGDDGALDLREGLGRDFSDDMMGVVATTPGVVFDDLLIVGGRVGEGEGAAPGHVRAYDIRTGEMRWIFHTIPQPGEFGYDTWPEDAWTRSGGANGWAGFAVDSERGLVFVPTGSATPDFNGSNRAGDNLFANTLLALDARTGERRWHYQVVRHDIWDRDLPAPPNLVEIERNGAIVPAVAQVTKTGHTFVFHRVTGEPLFPIREVPVVGKTIPGETVAPTQPVPTLPPPFTVQEFTRASVTDRTPEARSEIERRLETLHIEGLYRPASLEGTVELPGIDGGAEWGGAAWDAETGLLYVNANQVPWILQMVEMPDEEGLLTGLGTGYLFACTGCHGLDMKGDGVTVPSLLGVSERMGFFDVYRIIRDGRGRMSGSGGLMNWWQRAAVAWFVYSTEEADTPANWARNARGPKKFAQAGYQKLADADKLPGSKPPWGTLSAIDLARGEIRWQVPLGDYPQILEAGLGGLGAENYGGPVVTAGGLVFIAATPDSRLRGFDKSTGELRFEAELPTAAFATPAVYEASGRQFVAIAAGGGKLEATPGSLYVAFALP
ncbi:MAG: pyrroloquinoline quinone-dependent dehydrogenase [Myxococcales bacterium]|nr:pyrroloquinoline quinone-dependent dehydrogenase [Myxococcales bacterium]